jgi:copper(I)-binding protein
MFRSLHLAALTTLLIVSGCGGPVASPLAAKPVAQAGTIAISEPRVRIPTEGRDITAAYLTLNNIGTKPDALISASSTDAGKLELHAHVKTADGMNAMREINQILVPAGATIPLAPGGFHIMVKQLKADLKLGGELPITLTFSSGATAQFSLPVVANPSLGEEEKGHEHGKHQH